MNDHPDIEKLDASVREIVRAVFRDKTNGTPDNINSAGCLALAKQGKAAWNGWRSTFPVLKINHYQLQNTAIFENIDLDSDSAARGSAFSFEEFDFGEGAFFNNISNFGEHVHFNNASFGDNCQFKNVVFGAFASFTAARFEGGAQFVRCSFQNLPDFTGCQVLLDMSFNQTRFEGASRFWGLQVGQNLTFTETHFHGAVSFKASTWEKLFSYYEGFSDAKTWGSQHGLNPSEFNKVTFEACRFLGDVDFSGRTFLGRTEFVKTVGKHQNHFNFSVPMFHQCWLHQDTSFEGAVFPIAAGSGKAARAYRTLKQAFSKQQAMREEQRFFRLEMAEEAAMTTGVKRFLYKTYSLVSDYGFSLLRPFLLLLATLLVFSVVYALLAGLSFCLGFQSDCQVSADWFSFTLAQGLPLPGLDKFSEAASHHLFGNQLGILSLTAAVILHKATSLLALFLIGLGLRNMFKLK